MSDKKNKNKSQSHDKDQKGKRTPQTFEVHTMQSDNAQGGKKQPTKNAAPAAPAALAGVAVQQQAKSSAPKPSVSTPQKNKQSEGQNPFLTENSPASKQDTQKGSFAPGKQKEPKERINYTPDDIVSKGNDVGKKPVKKQKKSLKGVMITLIIIFILAAIGFGAYIFLFDNSTNTNITEISNTDNNPVEIPDNIVEDELIVAEDPDITDPVDQMYSTELPNYFSFNVESPTSEEDIAMELATITTNIQDQDIAEPLSFIVTDSNNNPVSFHVFAMSAGITLSQDVLSALEEDFEIYAYNDTINGVRFGFVIDAKDASALQSALLANEATLPTAFDIILNGMGTLATNVIFNDSTYNTHPIRYFNMNATESYSIDYTINDLRWVMGSSKNTMRVIIDSLKGKEITTE
ncbi:MAG: hypothetical protein U9Q12_02605 [Patescibacteria group bacterium]|nr:hypothetical protein [Patescibacteria group bacterium]